MTDVIERGEVSKLWPVEIVPLATLIEHPENFREHDVGAIAESIRRFGTWRAMVAQRSTRYVIVGNGELKALRSLGAPNGPVHFVDVDDDVARAIMLADNWIPGRGRNMPSELLDLMQELQADRELFEATGADLDDVEDLEREVAELDKPLKLDSRRMVRKTKLIECPECGAKFDPAKAEGAK